MAPAAENCIEIRVKGRWVTVPAVEVNGEKLFASGSWPKIATVRSEQMAEYELENPDVCIQELKREGNRALKADIFSFVQKVPSTNPKYSYSMEWESVAAVHLVSFQEWWEGLPQEARKNTRRAQKRGVEVRINEFNDELIQGIREVNDDSPQRQGMQK